MDIITITGWGQKTDALDVFASQFGSVTNIPYVSYKSIEELYSKSKDLTCDLLIGWSLGGQLASRVVAAEILKPKLLVLLAPSFQYVKGGDINEGTHSLAFHTFRTAYATFPSNSLREFGALVCQNDDHAMDIIATMDDDMSNHKDWIRWLDELGKFSCLNLDFSKFPRALIFHGEGDAVTPYQQGNMFHEAIKDSRFELIENCGHAPHLHDPDFLAEIIGEELNGLV